ncbi:MAG: PLP-dependent aminotransferase family protein [Planctomycetales bacterium]|nr:PLP-dependent aminotransferase family protein [Planctomycetales bacterium]
MSQTRVDSAPYRPSRRAALASGQPISELMHQALSRPELISLAAGFVEQTTLPLAPSKTAIDRLLTDVAAGRAALQYGTTAGYLPLREALLDRWLKADGVSPDSAQVSVDQVVITAGSNQLLHLAAESMLDPGDIVLCAAPTYFVFLGTLANMGIRSIGVASDGEGMLPDALEATLAELDEKGELPLVKAIYVTSYFDNPGSISLAEERRPQIIDMARRWSRRGRIFVIEDAAYRELRYEGEDIPSMLSFDEAGDTVISAGTFSKCYAPGLRVGWGILPRDLVKPVLEQKGNLDFGSPNFAQHVMHAVLEAGRLDAHIERLRGAYRKKRDAMLEAAEQHFRPLAGVEWIAPRGGLYVWVSLPANIDTGPKGTLFSRAMDAGVLYVPGQYCFPKEGPCQHNTIRLSFGVQPDDRIREGMRLLSEAIAAEMDSSDAEPIEAIL